jgi:hypothetical protein
MTLPDNHQSQLRQRGVLNENEVVAKEGDLYVATDVLTGAKRIVTIPQSLLENLKRRVLRD